MTEITETLVLLALGWVGGGEDDLEDVTHDLAIHPTFAKELADALNRLGALVVG